MLLIVLSIGIGSCGTIEIFDREVCADLGEIGARCGHTLTDEKRNVEKEAWDEERIGMLCMDSEAYTDAETALDQFCEAYPALCSYKNRKTLKGFLERMQTLSDVAQDAKDHHKGDKQRGSK